MSKFLSIASIKFLITLGMAGGGLAAWALDHFESKEHSKAVSDGQMKLLESIDTKLNILIDRK